MFNDKCLLSKHNRCSNDTTDISLLISRGEKLSQRRIYGYRIDIDMCGYRTGSKMVKVLNMATTTEARYITVER